MIIEVKIELTKVPKEKLFKSEDTGRIYLDCKVANRKEKDKFGNTHTLYIQGKDDAEKIYIGDGKEVEFKAKESAPITDEDDLGF
jgi:hypothetical protein